MRLVHLRRAGLLRAVIATVALGATTSALAACSDSSGQAGDAPPATASASASSSPADPSSPDGSSSAAAASPSSSSGASPSADGSTPAGTPGELPTIRRRATNLHVAILQSSVARTPEEKAVVTAWVAYWQAATDSTYLAREVPALARVSAGQARSSVQRLLRQNKAAGQRGVGWAKDNVTKVTVDGDRATVRDCTRNFTFNIDEEGSPASKPYAWYDASGRLERRGGRWLVVQQASPGRATSCLG